MQDILGESLRKSRKIRVRKTRMMAILFVLSFVVSLDVFWWLRQPGLTLAGDADCGVTEHTHDEMCQNGETPCDIIEHVHDISCYSDDTADVESQLDWQKMFEDYPYTGNLRNDLIGIAKTQVGYTESTKNFHVGSDGIRRGYNRYGAWYGTPYTDWSALFVSYCLHYAGADPSTTPGNTGANSMAEMWESLDKYVPVEEYTPLAGDLVFFKNNTVGIVTEIHTTVFHCIRGDTDGAVRSDAIAFTDSSIAGYGVTVKQTDTDGLPSDEELLDISDGPAMFIFEGGSPPKEKRTMTFKAARNSIEIIPYLEANGGTYFFTLLDFDNVELPKDENGYYMAEAGEGYKLTISFASPKGFAPGTYQYQVPNGLMLDGGEGTFVLKDGTNVGSWVVTDTGLITIVFNEHMNSRTEITISATLGIHFPEQEEPIDFDGLIMVTVKPPAQKEYPTQLEKWTNPESNTDKLIWHVNIFGHADSQIPGSILTDQITLPEWYKPHSYTQSDMDTGISFGAEDPDGGWHSWTVRADDPHLIWDESSWSYKIPHTVVCDNCGELELGNDGWKYYISYTSTPTPLNTPGAFSYANKVTIDGQTAWGWNEFTHGQVDAAITKDGAFVSDAAGGGFLWEIQVTIPGRSGDQKAQYGWAISDEMRLWNQNDATVAMLPNDINLASVTATYNGTIIQIPRIQDATEQDMFAWDNSWSSEGIPSTRTINILCRCQCTSESCHWGTCGEYWYKNNDGVTVGTRDFCQCWTETQNMTFTLTYKTTDVSLIEQYGALGYKVNNQAQLFYLDDAGKTVPMDKADVVVTIPKLFEKELTHDFDGYTASYKVTINESKLVLTNGTPLTIHDTMTDTLAFVSGSLVITTEDAGGKVSTLQQDVDYTIAYDGTGNRTDTYGKPVHILDIVILRPQPVMYVLNYDATLIIPDHITEGIKYSNSASITLWGKDVTDTTVEKVYADINIAAKSYKVEMFKTCADTGKPLGGATIGLFNAQGGLISTAVSDENGKLSFQSNIVEGIILRGHVLYYMQELRAPPGYKLDDTKHWFCFCDDPSDTCRVCDEVVAGTNAFRIPFEQIGKVDFSNEQLSYNLPTTGGPGIYPLLLVSVLFIITPLVYGCIQWRKRERRGVG